MTDSMLATTKKLRHEDGILQAYSRRRRMMTWGFDVRVGHKRLRRIGFRERKEAEAELSRLRMQEKCEQLGLPVDDQYLNSQVIWDAIEQTVSAKAGAIGAACEMLVAADLLRKGFDVYRAVAGNCDSDLIILKKNACARVEVKSAITKRGHVHFKRARFDKSKHEILALVFLREFKIEYRPQPAELFKRIESDAVCDGDL